MRIDGVTEPLSLRESTSPGERQVELRKAAGALSRRERADPRLAAGERIARPVQALVRSVVVFSESPESPLAGPSIDGQIASWNISVAQQFGALILGRRAEKLRPHALRPV